MQIPRGFMSRTMMFFNSSNETTDNLSSQSASCSDNITGLLIIEPLEIDEKRSLLTPSGEPFIYMRDYRIKEYKEETAGVLFIQSTLIIRNLRNGYWLLSTPLSEQLYL